MGKTFFTSRPYYIPKFSDITKEIHQRREDENMTKRKKYLVIGIVILSVAVFAGLGITAACGPHSHWHKGYHSGFHGEEVADFISWKMDRHVKDLNLDDSQRQEYDKVKAQFRASFTDAMERRKEFHRILYEEIRAENPDLNAVANLVKDRLEKMPDLIGENVDLVMDFYNRVLTDEQRTQVISLIRERWGMSSGPPVD
jgi:Spy/CpxP family protein refolding chaperone